jgi:hypothetical protein
MAHMDNTTASQLMAMAQSQELGGFSGKHWAKDQMNGHSAF